MTEGYRIQRVVLRKGTVYFVFVEDRLAGPKVLDRDVEVRVGDLADGPGQFNCYESEDGHTILVRFEDEVRDR